MAKTYNNIFQKLSKSLEGSPIAAWVWALCVVILLVGINYFAEDMTSSRWGMTEVEEYFDIVAASWAATYWFGSIALQAITVVLFYIYLSDRNDHWWAFFVSIGVQLIDIIFDMWYRSNGHFFESWNKGIVTFLYTFLVTVVLSEGFLTFGFGASIALFPEGLKQFGVLFRSVGEGFTGLMKEISQASPSTSNRVYKSSSNPQRNNSGNHNQPSLEELEQLQKQYGQKPLRKPRRN